MLTCPVTSSLVPVVMLKGKPIYCSSGIAKDDSSVNKNCAKGGDPKTSQYVAKLAHCGFTRNVADSACSLKDCVLDSSAWLVEMDEKFTVL